MSAGDVRALLERHGLSPNRELGQNFLIDRGVAERLAELAEVRAGQGVIEIGTGLGILTRALAARGAAVVSVEIDAGLVRALEAEGALPDSVTLVHGDALELDLEALARRAGPGARLVANLPYSVSAPLLRRLLDLRELLEDWSVMLQRDLAQRLLARPGSRDYGSLAVLHHLCVSLERRMELSPNCFYPVPKVRSTFLRMRPLEDGLPAATLPVLEPLLRAAFNQRRKTLVNALRETDFACDAALLEELGIAPGARAEQLAPESFRALAERLAGPG